MRKSGTSVREAREDLAPELRKLVKEAVALLGDEIREELGAVAYGRIEKQRRKMASTRGMSAEAAYSVLKESLEELRILGKRQRQDFAHAFALMLELMNACESAYRTWRLRHTSQESRSLRDRPAPDAIIYVLTAHPTESRSPEVIAIVREILRALVEWLEVSASGDSAGSLVVQARVRQLLRLAWRLSPSRMRKPSVRDEAESIDSMVLSEETLGAIIAANRELGPVYLRTWVGGDKDGHPGVDEARLSQSLQASRTALLKWAENGLNRVQNLAVRLKDPKLAKELKPVRAALASLRKLGPGDGRRVDRLRKLLKGLKDIHPAIGELNTLLRVFPGLVMPLELRESSDLIMQASAAGKGSQKLAITRMVARVRSISEGGDPKWYARGLIISMASSIAHVRAAATLVKREFGALKLPVIPLFEQNEALDAATQIAGEMLRDPALRAALHKHWGGHFEIMVGYSDSAKETGVLKSRLAIASAIHRLDELYRREQENGAFSPVFFHGSGGSSDRGGGSIDEQTAWWPASALRIYKATIQGETIERTTASREITLRRLAQIASRAESGGSRYRPSAALEEFAEEASRHYREKIAEPSFLEVASRATAYRYLSDLRLGSRPAKRGKVLSVQALRAIPWVMCWTQTRVLFPTWWGTGSAWKALKPGARADLKKEFARDPLFGSYIKTLASILARVELPIFRLYLEHSGLDPELAQHTYADFSREFALARVFVRELTGERELLWFRPWLGTSIKLRAPMIHPLNLVQVLTLAERDPATIRVTVTGISSGMMTTG
jgi:phosphoenolpyruvate carboxylase